MYHQLMEKSNNISNLRTKIYANFRSSRGYFTGLEISRNKICGGECDSCKFELNKNTLLFSIDVIGSYFRPCFIILKKEIPTFPSFLQKAFLTLFSPTVTTIYISSITVALGDFNLHDNALIKINVASKFKATCSVVL